MFLFLIALDGVKFSEDDNIQENDKQHAVKVSGGQDDQEPNEHVDGGPGALVEVLV